MRKIFYGILAAVLFTANAIDAQTVIKTVTLSNQFVNVPGTPRVIENPGQRFWLSIWRNNSSPSAIQARSIQFGGVVRPLKTLVTGVSVSVHSFDIAFDTTNNRYLLIYEAPQGLVVQLLNATFIRQGTPITIESGAVQTVPRILYDPVSKRYVIFWLSTRDGIPRKSLKSRTLDPSGRPLSPERILKTASGHYEFLSVGANPHKSNAMALLMEVNGVSAAVVGLSLRMDGTLLQPTAKTLQAFTPALRSFGDIDFSTLTGSGMAFWNHNALTKFRRITPAGGFAPTKQIASSGDQNSVQPTILFNEKLNAFAAAWTVANQVRFVLIHPETGNLTLQPITIATSTLANSGNLASGYDTATGNMLFVWDDFSAASPFSFVVRGAIVRSNSQ